MYFRMRPGTISLLQLPALRVATNALTKVYERAGHSGAGHHVLLQLVLPHRPTQLSSHWALHLGGLGSRVKGV